MKKYKKSSIESKIKLIKELTELIKALIELAILIWAIIQSMMG